MQRSEMQRSRIPALDSEIADLTAREREISRGRDPTRYKYTPGGLTHEEWYYSVLAARDPENRIKITKELLEDWRARQRGYMGRIYGCKIYQMNQVQFDHTMKSIRELAVSLDAIRDLIFLDPHRGIVMPAEMKDLTIPAIIVGTLRIIGEMPEFFNLTLGKDDMMLDDYY
jgi:hypothetical protein